MRFLLPNRCLTVACLVALVHVPVLGDESAVLSLDTSTFDAVLGANPLLAVTFYAPWCGHCTNLGPEFEKAARALSGRFTFAKVDATVEIELTERYHVDGYPTIHFFTRGNHEEYTGSRLNASIVQWVVERAGLAMTVATGEEEVQRLLAARRSGSYFVARGSAPLKELFGRLAEENRIMGSFVFLEATAGESPSVRVHRGSGEEVELSGESTAEPGKVFEFVRSQMLPLFGEIDEDNYNTYMAQRPAGMLWVCLSQASLKEDVARISPTLREVAAQHPSFFATYINEDLYSEHVRDELGCTEFPMVVLQVGDLTASEEEPKRYRLPLKEPSALEGLASWIVEAVEGRLEADDLEGAAEDEEDIHEEELEGMAANADTGRLDANAFSDEL